MQMAETKGNESTTNENSPKIQLATSTKHARLNRCKHGRTKTSRSSSRSLLFGQSSENCIKRRWARSHSTMETMLTSTSGMKLTATELRRIEETSGAVKKS